ncbi:UDP-glucose/GDP-mannose dehydrogenase family protein [Paludibacter sp. 221]|uniref:UDP-glucose dehydrogenase family protein n=1 Tax=Paludibacter sp. 221 TaxID=2302939 RepID=UPI0013D83245|nr:UDP-glucose/GDP-mannose dehydrogenase family protein [Paludibacter sp. 221]NDV46203.1 UDP-glucose/GDP-mannose dehydrogenase family protein [Paludibacter sp. 221]
MKIAIVGTGYVGLVTGTCFAEMGLDVTCIDVDLQKIENLRQGIIPIYEPGLDDMVLRNVKAERLHFSDSLIEVLPTVDVVFNAVGTPPDKDGGADLRYVLDVARVIGQNIQKYILIVTKSTVPVGTANEVRKTIQNELNRRSLVIDFDVASNPEFLKEGDAIKDFMSPDRVVVGVDSEKAKEILTKLYRPFLLNNFRVIFMDILSAEMTKYAANAMLATRISFMNDIANLCELVGADVNMVRKGIGTDSRIGTKFLYPGIGYGGSCFPKDIKALIHTGKENGYGLKVLQAVEEVNEKQKEVLFSKLNNQFDSHLKGKVFAIWGLAFKPNTDDVRDAPAFPLIEKLIEAGAKVRLFDPVAMEEAKKFLHLKNLMNEEQIYFTENIYDTVLNADALLLITEWKEFRMPNWKLIKDNMRGRLILDGRNIYDKRELSEHGFEYYGIGV